MLICQAWYTARVGVLPSKSKQPVLQTEVCSLEPGRNEEWQVWSVTKENQCDCNQDLAAPGLVPSPTHSLNRRWAWSQVKKVIPEDLPSASGTHQELDSLLEELRVKTTSPKTNHLPQLGPGGGGGGGRDLKNSKNKFLCYLYTVATRVEISLLDSWEGKKIIHHGLKLQHLEFLPEFHWIKLLTLQVKRATFWLLLLTRNTEVYLILGFIVSSPRFKSLVHNSHPELGWATYLLKRWFPSL